MSTLSERLNMKTQAELVNGIVDALFEDLASLDLVSETSIARDKATMAASYRDRGLPYFTITLPDSAKFLHSSLEFGRIVYGVRPVNHRAISHTNTLPRFLSELWGLVFEVDGQLKAEPNVTAIFWLRQIYLIFKKLDMVCDQGYVDEEISSWRHIEDGLPRSHPGTWDCENPAWVQRYGHPLWGAPERSSHDELFRDKRAEDEFIDWNFFRSLCNVVAADIGLVDIWAIRPKHGPGSIAERGQVRKYEFRSWPRKLNAIFPADWFASYDLSDHSDNDSEIPARMCVVPKTQKGPRLIASEPSAHQWIQGGVQRFLEDRVRSSYLGLSIDFRSQEYSRVLAIEASRTGAFATVDLSAASDRISTRLVEYVFQANQSLLDVLHACRSRALIIPANLDSRVAKDELRLLRKFAPMGSACTFPIQTIIFTMMAHVAICFTTGDRDLSADAFRRRATSIRVFGDDIIVPSETTEALYHILEECGLRVNASKSFVKGYFREACGMDAYMGHDVTPAYIRKQYDPKSPESLVSVVECSNNFHRKGLWHTADALLKTIPPAEYKKLLVARKDIGSVAIFTFVEGVSPRPKRWNKDLHRWEYRILTVTGKTEFLEATGEATALQYFMEEPDPMLPWKSGQPKRTRLKKRVAWVYYNQ